MYGNRIPVSMHNHKLYKCITQKKIHTGVMQSLALVFTIAYVMWSVPCTASASVTRVTRL